jgi:hypothetical protein
MKKLNSAASIGVIVIIIAVIIFGMAMTFSGLSSIGGSVGALITAVFALVFGGMFLLFYQLFFKPLQNARRLQKIGLPGKAKIIAVKDTGITINKSPMVKLEVEVLSSLGRRYNTSLKVLVSRLNSFIYTNGMEVPIKIDPENEKNVIVDTTASNHSFTQQNTTAISSIEEETLILSQAEVKQSGKPARAIVKKYHFLGNYSNGVNPFVELELEVLPDVYPSFSAKTKCIAPAEQVPKLQPGFEINVKYDYYDNSKVVVDFL